MQKPDNKAFSPWIANCGIVVLVWGRLMFEMYSMWPRSPSKPRKPSMTSKAKLKMKAPKNDLGYSSELLLPRWSAQREHIFGTQTYSSVPQAEHKLMIWHMQNCNSLMRILQVTENSPNNEGGGYRQVFLWKCCSGRKGVSKLNTARQNHARTPYNMVKG